MNHQAKNMMRSADAANKSKHFQKANQLYKKALDLDSKDLDLRIKYALSFFALNAFQESVHEFHTLHVEFPEDVRILNGCAVSYIRLGRFELAIQFLKKLVSKDPQDYDSWVNLCYAAGSSALHSDTIFYALQALQLKPLEPRSHNNMGSALLMAGRVSDALVSFDTALSLDSKNYDAMSNIATSYSILGKPAKALEIFNQCLAFAKGNFDSEASLRYRMSFDLLRMGELKQGWAMYDQGFIPKDSRSRNPKRPFTVPLWDGRMLEEKTLLIWREQGLGDELMFLSTLRQAQQRCKKIIVECDARLIVPLQRSFPDIMFREASFASQTLNSTYTDFDYQIPMGSLMGIFRSDFSDFEESKPFISPDPERASIFAQRLKDLPNRVKIGICWRSGVLNPERNSAYAPISEWESILRLPDVDFINLQYGECSDELRNVEEHFGVKIHQWPDLDLRNDLDGIFSLISCLDHVVTATTAISEMAPATGTPTSILFPHNSWVLFGTDRYLVHKDINTYVCPEKTGVAQLIPQVADDLKNVFHL